MDIFDLDPAVLRGDVGRLPAERLIQVQLVDRVSAYTIGVVVHVRVVQLGPVQEVPLQGVDVAPGVDQGGRHRALADQLADVVVAEPPRHLVQRRQVEDLVGRDDSRFDDLTTGKDGQTFSRLTARNQDLPGRHLVGAVEHLEHRPVVERERQVVDPQQQRRHGQERRHAALGRPGHGPVQLAGLQVVVGVVGVGVPEPGQRPVGDRQEAALHPVAGRVDPGRHRGVVGR